jgi:hypothetical protein
MNNYKTLMLGSVATSALLLGAAAPAFAESNVEVGHKGENFYIKSKDGKWSMIPGAQIQITYTFNSREEQDDVTEFAARRVRFGVAGKAGHKNLSYGVTLEISTNSEAGQDGDATIAIFDSYLNYKFSNALQVRAGTWKQRFTEYHSNSSGKTQFVDRNRGTSNRLRMERDTGLGIRGKVFKMLSYEATIVDGNTRKAPASNLNQSYHAHVRLEPFGSFGAPYEGDIKSSKKLKMQVAAAYFFKDNVTFSTRGNDNSFLSAAGTGDIVGMAFGAGFKWMGFGLYGEYAQKRYHDSEYKDKVATAGVGGALSDKVPGAKSVGWNIEGSYFLIPKKWSVAGRWEYFNDNTRNKGYVGTTKGVQDTGINDEHRFGIATSYFFNGHAHKLMADWVRIQDHGAATATGNVGGTREEDRFRLQWQARF